MSVYVTVCKNWNIGQHIIIRFFLTFKHLYQPQKSSTGRATVSSFNIVGAPVCYIIRRIATINYFHYWLICWLFFWSMDCYKIDLKKYQSQHLQMFCFVWTKVQNPKLFSLLLCLTKRSRNRNLGNWNLTMRSILPLFLLENDWNDSLIIQAVADIFFCWSTCLID